MLTEIVHSSVLRRRDVVQILQGQNAGKLAVVCSKTGRHGQPLLLIDGNYQLPNGKMKIIRRHQC